MSTLVFVRSQDASDLGLTLEAVCSASMSHRTPPVPHQPRAGPLFVGTRSKHREGVLAAIRLRLSDGRLEGIGDKTSMLKRRACGFHSAAALTAMIFLCCANWSAETGRGPVMSAASSGTFAGLRMLGQRNAGRHGES